MMVSICFNYNQLQNLVPRKDEDLRIKIHEFPGSETYAYYFLICTQKHPEFLFVTVIWWSERKILLKNKKYNVGLIQFNGFHLLAICISFICFFFNKMFL